MKRKRRFWSCRRFGPHGVHVRLAKLCGRCGGCDLEETVKRPSVAALINHAVADDHRDIALQGEQQEIIQQKTPPANAKRGFCEMESFKPMIAKADSKVISIFAVVRYLKQVAYESCRRCSSNGLAGGVDTVSRPWCVERLAGSPVDCIAGGHDVK